MVIIFNTTAGPPVASMSTNMLPPTTIIVWPARHQRLSTGVPLSMVGLSEESPTVTKFVELVPTMSIIVYFEDQGGTGGGKFEQHHGATSVVTPGPKVVPQLWLLLLLGQKGVK